MHLQTFKKLDNTQLFEQINNLEDICNQQQNVIKELNALSHKAANDIKFKNDLINKLITKNIELKKRREHGK